MKGKSLIEVFAVFAFSAVLGRWRYAVTESILGPLAQSYLSGAAMILIPVLLLILTRRDFAAYGFTLEGWRDNLDVGLTCYVVRFVSWGAGLGLIYWLRTGYRETPGALILSATSLVEIVLILAILRQREGRTARALPNLPILAALLLLPIAVGLALGRLTRNVVSKNAC